MNQHIGHWTNSRETIGWYIHIPFCVCKCGYCDFYSLPLVPDLMADFGVAVATEMGLRDPGRPVSSVFVGGGTPTVLSPDVLGGILAAISRRTGPVSEWTVEANPSSADELKLDILLDSGVNRLSLGAQSFRTEELAVLQRRHHPRQITESMAVARAAGFENINLDLIYAIPGQTLSGWKETLRRAIELAPDHLACYALTYEPGTELTRCRDVGAVVQVSEELEADMFELTIDELTAAGFEHYEISNFARPGRRCQANMIYWHNREYLGIGPSAASYLDGTRLRNKADVRSYVHLMRTEPSAVVAETEHLNADGRASETAVQMLRLTDGIDVELFEKMTGSDARHLFHDQIQQFANLGLLASDEHSVRLTRRGLLVSNRVMAEFLS